MIQEHNTHNTMEIVYKLINDSRDAEDGYRDAAEYIRDRELRAFFIEQSLERGAFASKLQLRAQRLGGQRRGVGGRWAHRGWIDAKKHLRSGDQGLLEAMEAGEERVRRDYEEALGQSLPPDLEQLLREQVATVACAHDHLRIMRERFERQKEAAA